MSGIGKKILTSAFNIALWAGMGAGLMAVVDSPQREQHRLPSLSQQDARKEYHQGIEIIGCVYGLFGVNSILNDAKARRREREQQLKPT